MSVGRSLMNSQKKIVENNLKTNINTDFIQRSAKTHISSRVFETPVQMKKMNHNLSVKPLGLKFRSINDPQLREKNVCAIHRLNKICCS